MDRTDLISRPCHPPRGAPPGGGGGCAMKLAAVLLLIVPTSAFGAESTPEDQNGGSSVSVRRLDSFLLGKPSHYDFTNVAFQNGELHFYAGDGLTAVSCDGLASPSPTTTAAAAAAATTTTITALGGCVGTDQGGDRGRPGPAREHDT